MFFPTVIHINPLYPILPPTAPLSQEAKTKILPKLNRKYFGSNKGLILFLAFPH
jgi:hypothetical protein